MQIDETLPKDLERVGRWFWLALLLGGALRVADFPVLFPILGVLLLIALHRLGRVPGPGVVRPDVALPALAVVVVELTVFATALPFLDGGAAVAVVAIATLATVGGIGSYVGALADFVRRAGLGDGRSIDHRARQWWITSVVLVVAGVALSALAETDTVPFDDDWGWVIGVVIAGLVVFLHGLYRVAHVQWTVLALLGRNRQRRSDNPGFVPTGWSD